MRRCAGFNLTEISCSIGIVAILIAVLSPVIAHARKIPESAMSASRHLSVAVQMYAADYEAETSIALQATSTGCIQDDSNWASQNGGCQDLKTGLVWSRTSDEMTGYYNRVYKRPPGDTRLPGAWDYCNTLAEGNCPDQPDGLCHGWRLPTKDEAVLAASHQIKNHASMRNPDAGHRAADPSWMETTGKNKGNYYIYWVILGTGEWGPALWKDKTGNYNYSVGDTICVRTP